MYSPATDVESPGSSKPKGNGCHVGIQSILIGVLIFVVTASWAAIAVLFVLYVRLAGRTHNSGGPTIPIPVGSAAAIAPNKAVSFNANGQAQAGAGHSIFKGLANLSPLCPKNIDVDAVFSDSYLVSYQNGSAFTTFKVVQIDEAAQNPTVTETFSSAQFYKVATLNQTSGLFVGISEGTAADASFVTAGIVDSSFKVQLGANQLYGCYQSDSLNPYISRLSDNSFAISHYCVVNQTTFATSISTQVGVVDPVTRVITMSPLLQYANETIDSNFNAVHNVVGLNATTYMVFYAVPGIPLTAIKITIDPVTLNLTQSAPFSDPLSQSDGVQFFDTARIDDSTAMVAFVDPTTEGGLTTVLVDATSDPLTPVRFGSRLEVTTGNTQIDISRDGGSFFLSMDFALTSLGSVESSSNPGAVLLFADVNNKGRMTAAALEVTNSQQIVRSSPQFVLNPTTNLNVNAQNPPLTFETAVSASSSSGVAFFSTISSGDCSVPAISDFSLLEAKAVSAGVMSSGSNLLIGGIASGYQNLATGTVYYSDTRGGLVASNVPYGRSAGYSALNDYIETDSVIVTLDALVGVAISDSAISLGNK